MCWGAWVRLVHHSLTAFSWVIHVISVTCGTSFLFVGLKDKRKLDCSGYKPKDALAEVMLEPWVTDTASQEFSLFFLSFSLLLFGRSFSIEIHKAWGFGFGFFSMKTLTFLGLPVFVPSLPLAFNTLSPKDKCRSFFETDETEKQTKKKKKHLSARIFCELELSSNSFCAFQKTCCCVVSCLGWLRVRSVELLWKGCAW